MLSKTKYKKYVKFLLVAIFCLVFRENTFAQSVPVTRQICSGICDIGWSPNGEILASVTQEGLWLVRVNLEDDPLDFYPFQNATSLDFNANGDAIAVTAYYPSSTDSRSGRSVVSIFNLSDLTWNEILDFDYQVDSVQFTPDDRSIVLYQNKPQQWGLQIIDLTTHETTTIVENQLTYFIVKYDFSPDGRYLAISSGSRILNSHNYPTVAIWDTLMSRFIREQQYEWPILDLFFSSNGSITFIDATAQITEWQFLEDTFSTIQITTGVRADTLHYYDFSDDGLYLAGSIYENFTDPIRQIIVWNVSSRQQVLYTSLQNQLIDMLTIDPSGTLFAGTSIYNDNNNLFVWNIEDNAPLLFVLSDE